jgi:hypothetical protein
MNRQEVNKCLEAVTPILDRIVDPEISTAISLLLNLVESLSQKIEGSQKEIQSLKDEVNKLKGEQGKPKVRPQKQKALDNHSSEEDRKKRGKKKEKKPRGKKKDSIKANRTIVLKMDTEQLPPDARRKGYKSVVIQDLKLMTDNVEFQREVYYSPSLKKTFTASLPNGYNGEFGPGIRALVLSLYHDSNMTQPALVGFFKTCGISISKATISRMLTDKHDNFHQEKENIIDAGLQAPYQHTDDTSARVNGKNQYVHILSNPFYTAYFTRPKKDRLTVLEILCRCPLNFTLNQESFQLMKELGLSAKRAKQLIEMGVEGTLTRAEIDEVLLKLFPAPKKHKASRRHILDASALVYYHSLENPLKHLMCDDAPQFNQIAQHKSLCWIHEGRHYKKLRPLLAIHQEKLEEFITKFWDYYQKLLDYTQQPTDEITKQLRNEFDDIFSTKTGYEQLDQRIVLTSAKHEALLLPLKFTFLPLHNNDAEGGAQHQARLRDIHLQTRNEKGTKVKDTFATMVKTARKLKVNFFNYVLDRITKKNSMPSLASLILHQIELQPDTS